MKYYILLLLGVAFMSCGDPDDCCIFPDNPEETPPVVLSTFEDIEIGDIWRFRHMFGYNYHSDEDERCYTNDTLVVTVEEIDADGVIHMSEKLSPASEQITLHSDSTYIWQLLQAGNRMEIKIENDSIEVLDGRYSAMTSIHRFLPLTVIDTVNVVFGKWKADPLLGNFCDEVEILDKTYNDLYLAETNDFAVDGEGSTIAYSHSEGIVRVTTYSAWTGDMWGWDRID